MEKERRKENMGKGGRPQKEAKEKKTLGVKVYFDEETYKKLLYRQKRTGKSLSSLIYELAVNGYVKEAVPLTMLKCIRDMTGMANNLNQLAHEAHLYGYHLIYERNYELAKKIDELLIRLSKS